MATEPARAALALARQTRAWTAANLAYDGHNPRTGDAWRSYRRGTAEPEYSDTWYNASQLLADAALAALGDAAAAAVLAPTVRHLEQHWDRAAPRRRWPLGKAEPRGGFRGRGGVAGDLLGGPDRYTDDNALVGLALLAAGTAADDAPLAAHCTARAVATAEFLTAALWDNTFGGGFWWNTRRGDTVEGKPAQSNGLAAHLFLRLQALTGEARWQAWAERTLDWLDAHLWDETAGLYRYCVRYADPGTRRGAVVEQRHFNYDQGILIECWAALAAGTPSGGALQRARRIAGALEDRFWDEELGGLVLEAGVPQVFLVYAAWLTPSLLALHAVDPDPRWLALARRNHDALWRRFADPRAPGAYAHRAWRDKRGQVEVDQERHTAAQAWMQHAQAALARALGGVAPRRTESPDTPGARQ